MEKSILNIGKALNRAEQKKVNGGRKPELCEVVDGVIYVCYLPTHCQLNANGTYSCV
ncbi:MAG: hypothetical protein JKY02_00555 [Flavobacteriaceae bacterium]|nr:hypothetical protein [Flavobacteriaceae bacterium]